ncbi:helix-turn-helix domain-containing protein [Kitasatospora sp. NPDC056800]|uniref:helix-turn-helix domain-containing protein n=1 Tax=Kitasatospora sp. NPDC056800 TaxID=3345948 RepID=UPI00367FF39D
MVLSTLETLLLTVAVLRQRTGESQRELAAAVGMTQDKISRRQSGAQPWSLDEVDALARHWGMGPLDLLAGPTHAALSLAWPPGTAGAGTGAAVPPAFAAQAPPTVPVTPAPDDRARPGQHAAAPLPTAERSPAVAAEDPAPAEAGVVYDAYADRHPDGHPMTYPPAPCTRCGLLVAHRIYGRPSHLGGACDPVAASAAVPVDVDQAAEPAPAPTTTPAPAPATPAAAPRSGPTARAAEAPVPAEIDLWN